MMKSLHKHLLAAGLVASLGAAAIAQTAPATPAPGPQGAQTFAHRGNFDPAKAQEHRAQRQEMRQLRMERRLAALKLKLQISGAQESAWNAWTTALKPAARPQRPDRAEFERMTTPERIDRMRALRSARIVEMDKRGEATKAFYAALSADQKKVFDGERMGQGGKRGGRGGFGGHGHHGMQRG